MTCYRCKIDGLHTHDTPTWKETENGPVKETIELCTTCIIDIGWTHLLPSEWGVYTTDTTSEGTQANQT